VKDPLTVPEVQKLARAALSQLYLVEIPTNAPPMLRRRLDNARGSLNELLLLCDLVDAVHDGIAVVVDRDDERS
jgi:hypothetical protein